MQKSAYGWLFLIVALGIAAWYYVTPAAKSTQTKSPQTQTPMAIPSDGIDGDLVAKLQSALDRNDCNTALPLLVEYNAKRMEPIAQFSMGRCLVETGDPTSALAWFEKAKANGFSEPALDSWTEQARTLSRDDQSLSKLQSHHFIMWVEGKSETWNGSDTLFPALESIYDQFCVKFNHYPSEPLKVVFYASADLQPHDLPDWTGALYDGKIRIPYHVLRNWPENRKILAHETAHAFVHDIAKTSVTPWLDEGIAQTLDGTPEDWDSLKSRSMPTLENLSRNFLAEQSRDEAQRLYQASHALFLTLYRDHANQDMGRIRTLLANLSEGTPLATAIQDQFQITLEELYQKTQGHISQ